MDINPPSFGKKLSRREFCAFLAASAVGSRIPPHRMSLDPADRIPLNDSEKEEFLLNARIIKSQGAGKGITGTVRATLTDGRITHDASIQTIDVYRRLFRTVDGTDLGLKDSYKFNVAAYRLARLLGIDCVPPSVKRSYEGTSGSYTWWIEDVIMDEQGRKARRLSPPDWNDWNQQMYLVSVFDQLIDNTDRNLGNLLITRSWKIWMIDHSRAFRPTSTLRTPKLLSKCERQLLGRIEALDTVDVKDHLEDCLTETERECLLSRRDLLIAHFAQLGESALYDRGDAETAVRK